MAQDLRELFKEEKAKENFALKRNHEVRFLNRLNAELPQRKKNSFFFVKIAAAVLVLVSVGFVVYQHLNVTHAISETTVVATENVSEERTSISLGDLSPDLKKVENYYVANINLQLSQVEISEDNKDMVDSFMNQLSGLNVEYETLNVELNEIGPNDQTISALIKNLELRLQLLQKLKKKLNQLKQSKNEEVETNII